jgi:hypothetical protein
MGKIVPNMGVPLPGQHHQKISSAFKGIFSSQRDVFILSLR